MKKVSVSIRGKYSIITRDSKTKELVKDKCLDVENTVTLEGKHWILQANDGAWYYYMTGRRYNVFPKVQFGTGTSAIVETDTALGGTVIEKGSSYVPNVAERANGLLTLQTTAKAVFSPGQATGTYGQVGLFYNTLLAGQQIKDEQGNPVAVTFLETEEVTVEYSIFHTWPCDTAVTSLGNQITVGSAPVTVGGQQHTCNIKGFGTILAFSETRDLDDNTNSMYPPWNNYTYNGNMKGYHVYTGDAVEGPFTKTFVQGAATCTGLEVITKGVAYRQRAFLSLSYTAYQNKYIKYMMFGGSAYNGVTSGSSRAAGTLHFDPPIFKGQGDELDLEFYIEYEIT